ncbi:uncharacterized protein LOC127510211 [Ctenopharyngodon idella]|uniref:uncharacterized protein LOC127510211 n=1 Tax=Ctenopharyngodon idella TaxID=7959 RepID=UPI00222FFD76|nr:uncharacterized protein LOC127510211 [Ctenopharyngodon idella]
MLMQCFNCTFANSMTVAFQNISSDPCYNYQSLDRPWRTNNESEDRICDRFFSWNGWYRFFYNGMNIQMPETCVSSYSCNTQITLYLNGPHPRIEDGVVIREVCGGTYGTRCCEYRTRPIRVKACPGNYYIYELVNPDVWCAGYCTSTMIYSIFLTKSLKQFNFNLIISSLTDYDPCNNYNTLNNYWRNILSYGHQYGLNSDYDDTRVSWGGWYRLYINGLSAQMPEWCVSNLACGGFSSLWLAGSHPRLGDGVVTREIYGSHFEECRYYRSNPIQVKACPGNYYVYKFTRPPLSIPAPVYCAVRFTTPSVDPCYNYNSLDEPWRATNNPYDSNYRRCDNFQGWYRLFYNGQSVQMPESCVNQYMCGTYIPMWLNGSHPQLEDGVVTRQICGSAWTGCCNYKSLPIQVKACPGNYYVYEFVSPIFCGAYCADVTRLNATTPATLTTKTTTPRTQTTATTSITTPFTTTATPSGSDPCYNYTTLDEYWRDIRQNPYQYSDHNDSAVKWNGWYRLYLNGKSAQMSEWCVSRIGCGGNLGLYLNGSHPKLEDGVVTRQVFGSYMDSYQCGGYRSAPIQVKACPGDYYVYKLVKPDLSIYKPSYCAVAFQNISSDPCYNYESLDRPWRANNESGEFIWEESFSWNGCLFDNSNTSNTNNIKNTINNTKNSINSNFNKNCNNTINNSNNIKNTINNTKNSINSNINKNCNNTINSNNNINNTKNSINSNFNKNYNNTINNNINNTKNSINSNINKNCNNTINNTKNSINSNFNKNCNNTINSNNNINNTINNTKNSINSNINKNCIRNSNNTKNTNNNYYSTNHSHW